MSPLEDVLEDVGEDLLVHTLTLVSEPLERWITARLTEGRTPEEIRAEADMLFASADVIIDTAADRKFGSEAKTKP